MDALPRTGSPLVGADAEAIRCPQCDNCGQRDCFQVMDVASQGLQMVRRGRQMVLEELTFEPDLERPGVNFTRR